MWQNTYGIRHIGVIDTASLWCKLSKVPPKRKRTVWVEVRSENKSWYYDKSLLIYFHFPLPLRASCMAGVVPNATQLSKLIFTNSARRPQQENGSWHKRGIGLKASFRIRWNATRLAQKSATILFITSGMRTTNKSPPLGATICVHKVLVIQMRRSPERPTLLKDYVSSYKAN